MSDPNKSVEELRDLNEAIRDVLKDDDIKQNLNESFLMASAIPFSQAFSGSAARSQEMSLAEEIAAILEGGGDDDKYVCECNEECEGDCDCECSECSKQRGDRG